MRAWQAGLWCLVVLVGLGWPGTGVAEPATARVTYVTARTVYIDLGANAGLRVGQRLELRRDGEVVAQLEVRELSSRRAACSLVEGVDRPVMGDSVVPLGALNRSPSESGAHGLDPSSRGRRSGLHGRVAVDLLYLRDESGLGRDLWQPAARLRLKGRQVLANRWDADIDIRTRRSIYSAKGQPTLQRNRIYKFTLSTESHGVRWSFGRQYSTDVGAFGLVDGAQMGWRRGSWELQALGGTQPDGLNLGFRATSLRAGFMLFHHHTTTHGNKWRLGMGYAGSYDSGHFDREFVHLRSRYSSRRFTLVATQDVDVNRVWKHALEGKTFSLTRSHLLLRSRLDDAVVVFGGYDNRRPIRRYRDLETPETRFDDRYRQGLWAGLRHRLNSSYSWGVMLRSRRGASQDGADALTLDLRGSEDWKGRWWVVSRSTAYRNDLVDGWLQSGRLGWGNDRGFTLELFAGLRHENGKDNDLSDFTDPWFGWGAEAEIGSRWSVGYDFERSFEGNEAYQEHWFSATLRL